MSFRWTDFARHVRALVGGGRGLPSSARSRADETSKLRAALDKVEDGIILLDADLRVDFINRSITEVGGVHASAAEQRLPFEALMREVHEARNYTGLSEDFETYLAARVAALRAGDPEPVELRLGNGAIIRCRCTALPDGGRMLSYTNVTDLVRRNEELESLRAALFEVEYGVVLLDRKMRARFINRAFRKMAEMPDAFADSRPTYEEILEHGRRTDAFPVPAGDVDDYISARIALVRETQGLTSAEIRWSRGRVVRFNGAALPGGGRMLTYTDITDLAQTADQLEKLATTDSLTGLYNRRHFITVAEREWTRFRRYGRPLTLVMLDIDAFKGINDRYGHDVGDRMIVHVAELCQANKRDSDYVARVGGEEFALLLPETELESGHLAAERLRAAVANRRLAAAGTTIPVTVSLGVAEADALMTSLADLMKQADHMMYEAKRAGRNRVASARWSGEGRLSVPSLTPALAG